MVTSLQARDTVEPAIDGCREGATDAAIDGATDAPKRRIGQIWREYRAGARALGGCDLSLKRTDERRLESDGTVRMRKPGCAYCSAALAALIRLRRAPAERK